MHFKLTAMLIVLEHINLNIKISIAWPRFKFKQVGTVKPVRAPVPAH